MQQWEQEIGTRPIDSFTTTDVKMCLCLLNVGFDAALVDKNKVSFVVASS